MLAGFKVVLQILEIVIQKVLRLDEINEHQTVQRHRDIPTLEVFIGYTFEKFQECSMFIFEALIEFLGNLLHVKSRAHAIGGICNSIHLPFFIHREKHLFQTMK